MGVMNRKGELSVALHYVGISKKPLHLFDAHTHGVYEIVLNFEGEGRMTIGDMEYPFFPGSIHIIPPNTSHFKQSESTFRDIFLQTDTISFSMMSDRLVSSFAYADDEAQTLFCLMRLLLFRYLKREKNDHILQSLYELILRKVGEDLREPPEDPLVESIKQRLMLSVHDPECSVNQILQKMGYHPDYLRRRFVGRVGKTPQEYLLSLRMTNARALLEQKEARGLSIAEIGVLCGYYDPHYFSRVFKKEMGYSPREYVMRHNAISNESFL